MRPPIDGASSLAAILPRTGPAGRRRATRRAGGSSGSRGFASSAGAAGPLLRGIGGGSVARAGEVGVPKSGSMRPGAEGGMSGDGPLFGGSSLGGGKLSLAAGDGGTAVSLSFTGNGRVGVPAGWEVEARSLPRKPALGIGLALSGPEGLLV